MENHEDDNGSESTADKHAVHIMQSQRKQYTQTGRHLHGLPSPTYKTNQTDLNMHMRFACAS
eukprot:10889430-Lingulodinium_polyedra.AAC.1